MVNNKGILKPNESLQLSTVEFPGCYDRSCANSKGFPSTASRCASNTSPSTQKRADLEAVVATYLRYARNVAKQKKDRNRF